MSDALHIEEEDTETLKQAVLRPQKIREHRPLIEEMDSALSDQLISGDGDNPRLRQILEELASDSERARVESSIRELGQQGGDDCTLHQALLDHLALLRADKGIELARLQIHAIGIYRRIQELLHQRQSTVPLLDEIRELPASATVRLLAGRRAFFGDPDVRDDLVATPSAVAAVRRDLHRLMHPAQADSVWDDADGAPPLPDKIVLPLRDLPDDERESAMRLAQQDQVRSRYYRAVFIGWYAEDTLDIDGCGYRTVLDWLLAIEETPHLFSFMQGQTDGQKAWRLARLTDKLLQMHEIYARTGFYARQSDWRERLHGLDTRGRLAVIVKERLPALPLTTDVAIAVVLLPFPAFARWVQQRFASKDFVLPPDKRR